VEVLKRKRKKGQMHVQAGWGMHGMPGRAAKGEGVVRNRPRKLKEGIRGEELSPTRGTNVLRGPVKGAKEKRKERGGWGEERQSNFARLNRQPREDLERRNGSRVGGTPKYSARLVCRGTLG